MTDTKDMPELLPCPFCGGEAEIKQTGKSELTLLCVGIQPSGLRGCGPKFVQRVKTHSLEWLSGKMAERWNRRFTAAPFSGWDGESKLTVEQAWTILCETPDITSPEEYPDHALITMEQLGSFMARAAPEAETAERERELYRAALQDDERPMESDSDEMTAAESVLAYLYVEIVGAPDDEAVSPLKAQKAIEAKLSSAERDRDAAIARAERAERLLAEAEMVIDSLIPSGVHLRAARAIVNKEGGE